MSENEFESRVMRILSPCLSYWIDEQTIYLVLNLSTEHQKIGRPTFDDEMKGLRENNKLAWRIDPLSRLPEWKIVR